MELSWEDIVIDKRAVMANPEDLLADWLWLAPPDAEPMLPTACGDLFLQSPDGSIALLDTCSGTCDTAASSYDEWKAMLNDAGQMEEWFRSSLLADLLKAGLSREPGQCFSPFVPQVVSGSWEPSNFHACDLVVHLSMLGQIHRQVNDLPPGTKISSFDIVGE
jgi:hypothetical protein